MCAAQLASIQLGLVSSWQKGGAAPAFCPQRQGTVDPGDANQRGKLGARLRCPVANWYQLSGLQRQGARRSPQSARARSGAMKQRCLYIYAQHVTTEINLADLLCNDLNYRVAVLALYPLT